MKILGIHTGHHSHFCLIEDGTVKSIYESERFSNFKAHKLHALSLEEKDILASYQFCNVKEFKDALQYCLTLWGKEFDYIGIENQGRVEELENIKIILKEFNVKYKEIEQVNHHLSHACGIYFTSPYPKALVLSFDGSGNDGKTILFHAEGNNVSYLKKHKLSLGRVYNNLGFILNVKPEIFGQTAGKIMGLAGFGDLHKEWIPYIRKHILSYRKIAQLPTTGPKIFGKGHIINSIYLDNIKELKPYHVNGRSWAKIILKIADKLGLQPIVNFINRKWMGHIQLDGEKNKISQDLMKTFQHTWTEIVLELLEEVDREYEKFCITGGCALNGITNYYILKKYGWDNVFLIPNPSDCGLAIGASLKVYWDHSGLPFNGYNGYYDPYVGMELFDKDKLEEYKKEVPNRVIPSEKYIDILARLLNDGKIIGLIQGKCEIGPRALGNRSILCNPSILDMKRILNEKVKHREWFRPFAPICTLEDSPRFFTVDGEINYMSVICYTKEEYRDKLPAITHVDGTARLQTITKDQNPFIYKLLKNIEKYSTYPILLNTSLNPRGRPILNYLKISLEMLKDTGMDYTAYNNIIFGKLDNLKDIDKYLE